MVNYWSSLFVLPKAVLAEVNKLLRNFLWSGTEFKHTGAKWVRVQLVRDRCFWTLGTPQNCSSNWKKILQLKGVARSMILQKVGNGEHTYFWEDNWLHGGPLSLRVAEGFLQDSQILPHQRLSSLISDGDWSFPASILEQFPAIALIAPPSSSPDSSSWIPSPTGSFTLCHTIGWLEAPRPSTIWHHLVWSSLSVPRCKFSLWLAVQNRLSTLNRSSMRDVPGLRLCHLCNFSDESHDHLFFACTFARPIWVYLQHKSRFHAPPSSWNYFVAWASHNWSGRNLRCAMNRLTLSSAINKIWEERNNRAFRNQKSSQMVVLRHITELIRQNLLSRQVKDSPFARKLALHWDLPSFVRPPAKPPDLIV
ncbi:uncharacterized protein LOC132296457 [Cornus florida]|uniref:uncharacterized protein LOC132296457 n=1 Tax=Cornus florida TaxID=4283 RepID=UPI00289D0D76|nr:uncharacterized protein LOC132296457 [Cornus florida]